MFKIVYSKSRFLNHAVSEVEEEVKYLKDNGWTEQGGISISRSRLGLFIQYIVAQAMIKKE